ncbi:MAG: class II fumarate hydratase [Spirochaetia bacterium]
MKYRAEKDSMGIVQVPDDKLWGAQTQRAVENFGTSEYRIPEKMLKSIGLIKAAAASVNADLGLIPRETGKQIEKAGLEIHTGNYSEHFPTDVFQTGSGTSWNMNANEVIANIVNKRMGHAEGENPTVHPNDTVNRCQSSNDVIPSAVNIACRSALSSLHAALLSLEQAFEKKEGQFHTVLKLGRTHLQDAVPMRLGHEFGSYKTQIAYAAEILKNSGKYLEELPLGGTAIGTGLNAHPDFSARAVQYIAEKTGIPFTQLQNKFEGIAARDAQLHFMDALNSIAVKLMKICQDLRLLSSGPRAGLGEITLPSLQPGSSIMPGKVNPVIPEMVIQAAAHIMGKHTSVTIACQNSPLELNIMQPLLAHETLSAAALLERVIRKLDVKCVQGIEANRTICLQWIEKSLALATPLALTIGYDKAAEIAYTAFKTGKTIRDVAAESGILPEKELDQALDPEKLAGD